MATRSTIAIENPDGTVYQIYCHYDGYLSHVGRILFENYSTTDAMKELLCLGDLSVLGERVDPDLDEDHSFAKPAKGVCIAYGRDRGEADTLAREYTDFGMYTTFGDFEEYNYIRRNDGKLYLIHNSMPTLVKLLTADNFL